MTDKTKLKITKLVGLLIAVALMALGFGFNVALGIWGLVQLIGIEIDARVLFYVETFADVLGDEEDEEEAA